MRRSPHQFLPWFSRGGGPAEGWWRGLARRRPAQSAHRESGFTSSRDSAEHGFTLVELMVVILILGLLATIVIINVLPATDTAAVTKAKTDVATLEEATELYRVSKLAYPNGSDGLQALVREGYVKRLPRDPWGNPYHYAAPGRDGRAFDIYSYGADGREGGEGKDADIGNWES
jgi:general secretion pathway protein G